MLKKLVIGISLICAGCTTLDVVVDRPNPDFVVKFEKEKFNNSHILLREFQASNKLLLVAVTNKEQAHKASKDLKSIIDTFDNEKNIYVAYRQTNLPSEYRVVEIFDTSDKDVPELLGALKQGSIDEYGRWFSESEMQRFESTVYSKSVQLSGYLSVQAQLADLLQNFGWTLLDQGAFMTSEHAPYFPKKLMLEITTLEPMKATRSEAEAITKAWSDSYQNLTDQYQFFFDVATQTVSYVKKETILEKARFTIDEIF
ncbi:hypothetical protein [Pseudoalteromonas luteoviolacea]|uniref:Uncharacterized protein n=1 Tax=Pseudoalteromonas luteoviolacea S4060-1 TaxID=1365257 RepID=A0A162BKC9_9GAMM|nr:hypothetical protein [Pseudoalteromonas luteoviolacea]KZN63386.1 hypothetical protein N478_03795 [Pseudoalteromonas luteoviolacea S4060-1]